MLVIVSVLVKYGGQHRIVECSTKTTTRIARGVNRRDFFPRGRSNQLQLRARVPDISNLGHEHVDHPRAHVPVRRTAQRDFQRPGGRDRFALPHILEVRHSHLQRLSVQRRTGRIPLSRRGRRCNVIEFRVLLSEPWRSAWK